MRCTVTVHQDIASWIYYVLATAAILQNDLAHSHTVALAKACGGSPAGSNHPSHGVRNDPNSSMNVPARMIVPAGAEPSKFVGAQCAGLERFLAELAEQKGGMAMSMLRAPRWRSRITGYRPAISRIAVPLTLGSRRHWCGCSPTSRILSSATARSLSLNYLFPRSERAVSLANDLNLAESAGGYDVPPLFGAWVPDPFSEGDNGLAFSSFLPNFLAMGGILNNWIAYQATRGQFARRFLDD